MIGRFVDCGFLSVIGNIVRRRQRRIDRAKPALSALRLWQFEAESFSISADYHVDVRVDFEAGQGERERVRLMAPVGVLELDAVPGDFWTAVAIFLPPVVLSSS